MAQRSGSADLPLHGGRVPSWLASRMANLGAVICQADRPSLWPRRISPAPFTSILVPVARRGHGDGLAFLGHHHERHRRLEAGPLTARTGAWTLRLWRTR